MFEKLLFFLFFSLLASENLLRLEDISFGATQIEVSPETALDREAHLLFHPELHQLRTIICGKDCFSLGNKCFFARKDITDHFVRVATALIVNKANNCQSEIFSLNIVNFACADYLSLMRILCNVAYHFNKYRIEKKLELSIDGIDILPISKERVEKLNRLFNQD